ncbi:MAG: 2OG-Fe(II) oxygenase [Bacillota bacterium]
MQAARRQLVDGREIRIYDGLLSQNDIYALTKMFDEGAFTRTEWARPETAALRHWALNIPKEVGLRLPVYGPMMEAAKDIAPGRDYRIYRCYCNHASYGDMLFTHTDCKPDQDDLTALWYIAPEWDVEWGGETLFFNAMKDAEAVVSPRPGRLVIFDGKLLHAGRPPNRACYAPRYTLAYKLEPVRV